MNSNINRLKYYFKSSTELNEEQLEKVINCFKQKTVSRNTILLSQGEVCNELYFVHAGCVRTYYLTPKGQEKTRFIGLSGSFTTAIGSFISHQPSAEFVDTLEDSELLSINREDFYQCVNEIPEWSRFYQQLLEKAYLYQNEKIGNLVTLSAKQRYIKLFTEAPSYFQKLSNKVIASYLDITQETLSRLKSSHRF